MAKWSICRDNLPRPHLANSVGWQHKGLCKATAQGVKQGDLLTAIHAH